MADGQFFVDSFYVKNGPCCAGCDHWRHVNSMVGECLRSAPVASGDRTGMLGISGSSPAPAAGHTTTRGDHRGAAFDAAFDGPLPPPYYLRSIGRPGA